MMDENSYLSQWLNLKDHNGLANASSMANKFLFLAIFLTLIVLILVFYKVNTGIVLIFSVPIGWVIAERNALLSRVKSWPQLEKYLDWEKIRKNAPR